LNLVTGSWSTTQATSRMTTNSTMSEHLVCPVYRKTADRMPQDAQMAAKYVKVIHQSQQELCSDGSAHKLQLKSNS
jgi:hypothetical protein